MSNALKIQYKNQSVISTVSFLNHSILGKEIPMQTLVTLPHFSANTPLSKRHLKQFPPSQYPLCLSITFTKRAINFHDHLKTILDGIPKNEVKYKSNKNIATTFNCYCHSLESIKPVLNDALGYTQMYVRFGLIEDKRVFPDDLWKQGVQILANDSPP